MCMCSSCNILAIPWPPIMAIRTRTTGSWTHVQLLFRTSGPRALRCALPLHAHTALRTHRTRVVPHGRSLYAFVVLWMIHCTHTAPHTARCTWFGMDRLGSSVPALRWLPHTGSYGCYVARAAVYRHTCHGYTHARLPPRTRRTLVRAFSACSTTRGSAHFTVAHATHGFAHPHIYHTH